MALHKRNSATKQITINAFWFKNMKVCELTPVQQIAGMYFKREDLYTPWYRGRKWREIASMYVIGRNGIKTTA